MESSSVLNPFTVPGLAATRSIIKGLQSFSALIGAIWAGSSSQAHSETPESPSLSPHRPLVIGETHRQLWFKPPRPIRLLNGKIFSQTLTFNLQDTGSGILLPAAFPERLLALPSPGCGWGL